MEKGNMVLALAGKEKGKKYVVVECNESYVYIADGKRLKKDKPKKKNLKHVKLIGQEKLDANVIDEQNERVNAAIRKFLKERSDYVQRRCD